MTEQTKKTISFDLDGTILERDLDYCLWGEMGFEGVLWQFIGKQLNKPARQVYEESLELYSQGKVPNGTISIKAWLNYYNSQSTEQEIIDATEQELKKFGIKIRVYNDYNGLVEKLKQKGHRVVLLTESSRYLLDRKLGLVGISKDFDAIYSSIAITDSEKTTEFYRRVLELERASPENILHIGDSVSKDYEIPKKLGIKSLIVNPLRSLGINEHNPRVPKENQILSLHELLIRV